MFELNTKERSFLNIVYKTVLANPFASDPSAFDVSLGIEKQSDGIDFTEKYIHALDSYLKTIDKRLGRVAELKDFSGNDRELFYYFICFRYYHECIYDIDDLAVKQLSTDNKSLPVTFADKAINGLCSRGFSLDDAIMVFSYFYQLRRSWLFITTRLSGQSECMQKLRAALWNNIFTSSVEIYTKTLWYRMEDFSTLLLGPTGSGKGAAAQAIGYGSFIPFNYEKKRFDVSYTQNFVSVNLSQFPETLVESELFGHARGAFTGAVDSYNGLFARCSQYGSIFLDEIAEIQLYTQVKLLQVLEERTYSPLGSHSVNRFQGRVIGATHQPIEQLCQEGKFRSDLYYRLCSDVIRVPSLRKRLDERPSDLVDLVEHLLNRMLGRKDDSLIDLLIETLNKELAPGYQWPGNVRELAQLIRRILLKRTCKLPDISLANSDSGSDLFTAELSVSELTAEYCQYLYRKYNSYQDVSKITGLNWRTVKKYCNLD